MKTIHTLIAAIFLCALATLHAAPALPNIILVMPDDLGYGDYACLGNPIMHTPSVDAFKKESLLFTQFHVSPTCSPCRAALMSGRHEFKNGVTHTILERERMNLKTYTLPQMLKSVGYTTGIFGKWHLGDEEAYRPESRGFDEVIPYEEGSKAPLIIYDPRLPADQNGKVSQAITGNIDMAATIFALAGLPAPSGIDGKNLLPLLANPKGQVREFLPLFNFWGIASAQSMAVVTPEWKYIYWYYGDGMKPTEELFHIGNDRYEMSNSASDANYAGALDTMRRHYDAEVADLPRDLAQGHSYESYPKLFDRNVAWAEKAPLVKGRKVIGDGEGEAPAGKNKNQKKNAN